MQKSRKSIHLRMNTNLDTFNLVQGFRELLFKSQFSTMMLKLATKGKKYY